MISILNTNVKRISDQPGAAGKSFCYFIATSWNDQAVPRHLKALADELVRRGHRVILLVDGQRHDLVEEESNPAIYTWPSKRPTHFRDARFLYRLIKHYRPNCLVANFGADNWMTTIGWLMRVPCRVNWFHTLFTQIQSDSTLPKWKLNLLRLRKRLVYRLSSQVVPVSWAACEDAQRSYGVAKSKCKVFHNALFDPLPGRESVEPDRHDLVCVGRLSPSKGQDVVIRAISSLRHSVPDLSVEFIGDGPTRTTLLELAKTLAVEDRCRFVGALGHDQVLERMASAYATVVPSRSEAFGLVGIESLAVGTPVIGSLTGGLMETIRDGVDGFLVPADDPESLAKKLLLLLSAPELRRSMSKNARERFLSHFENQKVVSDQVTWLESIVTSGLTQ